VAKVVGCDQDGPSGLSPSGPRGPHSCYETDAFMMGQGPTYAGHMPHVLGMAHTHIRQKKRRKLIKLVGDEERVVTARSGTW